MRLLRAGCCKRIPSAYVRVGKPCAKACVAQGFLSKVLPSFPNHVVSGTDTDRVVADTFGVHPEFFLFGDDRIDAVEETLVKRRKRIGRAGLTEQGLGIRDHHLRRQAHQYRLLAEDTNLLCLKPSATVPDTRACALSSL